MTKEEVLTMEVGEELDRLVGKSIFVTGKRQWIKCYSANISFVGEIIEQLFNDDLITGFFGSLREISHGRTFPEAVCKAALLAKLEVSSANTK